MLNTVLSYRKDFGKDYDGVVYRVLTTHISLHGDRLSESICVFGLTMIHLFLNIGDSFLQASQVEFFLKHFS